MYFCSVWPELKTNRLYETGFLSDVTIKYRDLGIKAHKSVLAKYPGFKKLISNYDEVSYASDTKTSFLC